MTAGTLKHFMLVLFRHPSFYLVEGFGPEQNQQRNISRKSSSM